MRHAQSAEKQTGQSDKERELTPLGLRQSMQIGNFLHKNSFSPDIILSSTAIRAQQTASHILDSLKLMPEIIKYEEELYSASVRTFFHLISQLDTELTNVLIIAHNPTISYLAEYLTKSEIGDMPPAALAMIQFNLTNWNNLAEGSGRLLQLITPELLSHDD